MLRVLVCLFSIIFSLEAFATGIPRPIGGENRIKIVNYTPNTVFRFVGHYEFQSIIEFGLDEEIDTISMGTPTPWQIVPAGNRIFIKPVEEEASTNMTVITNKRMYFFEMHAAAATSVSDENLNYIVKFVYPSQFGNVSSSSSSSASAATNPNSSKFQGPDLSKPEDYNFNYSVSGPGKKIEPLMVFDDGEFTYFKFKDINADLPAIYFVNSDGKESLVNYRSAKGYIWIERVGNRFTLRSGSDTICVYNETGPFKKKERSFLIF
jgi:type IV secretion system protein VirB9